MGLLSPERDPSDSSATPTAMNAVRNRLRTPVGGPPRRDAMGRGSGADS